MSGHDTMKSHPLDEVWGPKKKVSGNRNERILEPGRVRAVGKKRRPMVRKRNLKRSNQETRI